jgi:MFS transporter, ACS family, hexuronate transporter
VKGEAGRLESTKGASYQWVILAVIWCSHTIYFVSYMAVGTLAPLMKSDLGLSSARIGVLVSAITIGSTAIQIPVGMLADRFGGKWMMAGGLVLVGLSTICVSFLSSYVVILGLLFLVGVGIGGNQTPGSKAIIMWFPERGRATGMGIKQTGVSTGGALASFFLPALALQFNSWRYAFAAAGLAAVGSALLICSFYRDPKDTGDYPLQDRASQRGRLVGLLKRRDFMMLCCTGIFLIAVQFALAAYFIMYVSSVLHFPISKCGFLLGLSFVSGAVGRVGWSLVSDYLLRGNRKAVLTLIGIVGAATYGGLVMLRPTDPPFLVYVLAIFLGLTSLGWNAVYLTRVGELAGRNMAGTATGISFVITNLGAILGPPLFGYLVDLTGGYRLSWMFTAFCMVSVVILGILQGTEEPIFTEERNGR